MPRHPKPLPTAPRSELVAILSACKERPEEDAPRLVLSDWLEEHGEVERAELVRVQCRLARDEDDPDWLALRRREGELLRRHGQHWLAPFANPDWSASFERGLVQLEARGDRASVKALLGLAETEAWAWVGSLDVRELSPSPLAELAGSPAVFALRDVYAGARSAGAVAERVAALPAFATLRSLSLRGASLTEKGAADLAGAAHLKRLASLDLCYATIGVTGLRLLLDSPHLRAVERLYLTHCTLGPGAARALTETAGMPALRHVDLSHNRLGVEGAGELARCGRGALCELDLSGNDLGDAGLRALAGSDLMGRLTSLKLGRDSFTCRGLEEVLHSPRAAALEKLQVGFNYVTEGLGRVLGGSPHLGGLRSLGLATTCVGPADLRALLGAAWLPALRELDLESVGLGDAGARALAESPALAGCRSMSFYACGIGPVGARALAASPHLRGLRLLSLLGFPVGDAGARAVLDSTYLAGLHYFFCSEEGLRPETVEALKARFRP